MPCPECGSTKIVVTEDGSRISLRCKEDKCGKSFTLQPTITLNELRSILAEGRYEEERVQRESQRA